MKIFANIGASRSYLFIYLFGRKSRRKKGTLLYSLRVAFLTGRTQGRKTLLFSEWQFTVMLPASVGALFSWKSPLSGVLCPPLLWTVSQRWRPMVGCVGDTLPPLIGRNGAKGWSQELLDTEMVSVNGWCCHGPRSLPGRVGKRSRPRLPYRQHTREVPHGGKSGFAEPPRMRSFPHTTKAAWERKPSCERRLCICTELCPQALPLTGVWLEPQFSPWCLSWSHTPLLRLTKSS